MDKNSKTKKVAFKEGNSWYHRVKVLREDGSTLYSKRGGFSSASEAEESYYKCLSEYEKACRKQQGNKRDTEISLRNYLEYWLNDVYSPRIENTTRMLATYTLYDLLLPCLEQDVKLKYVNVDFLNEWIGRAASVCESAGNKSRELLNQAFKDAVVEGYIKDNPVPNTIPYKRRKPKVTILSKPQLKKFLQVANESEWKLEIYLGLFCALRKGEIYGLKFDDWDENSSTISICRQITSNPVVEKGNGKVVSYKAIEKQPKTDTAYRCLRVPDVVTKELIRRRELVNSRKEKMGDLYFDGNYISARENGLPHSISSMNIALAKLCKRGGIPHISVHGLRHQGACILAEQGVPLAKISAYLGHKSVHTTFEYYTDVVDENNKILAFINDKFLPEEGE